MAYREQPRRGNAPGQQYGRQQPSHMPVHQPYAAEYDYNTGEPGVHYNDKPGPPPQQYSDTYEQTRGSSKHNGEQWQDSNSSAYGYGRRRGSREQVRGGRPPAQGPMGNGRQHSDPYDQRAPRSKSKPPERTRNKATDPGYQANGYQQPRGHQQEYHSGQPFQVASARQASDNYQYDDSYNHQSGVAMDQGHGYPSETRGGYRDPQDPADYPQHGYPSVRHANTFHTHDTLQPGTARSTNGAPSISSRSEASQRSKASSKRVIGQPLSPDTVAWDNPFPTFPMRPKKATHPSSRSGDGTVAEMGGRRYDNTSDSRPQTASSKSSSYTIPQPIEPSSATNHSYDDHSTYPYHSHLASIEAAQNSNVAQGEPSFHQDRLPNVRFDNLQPPTMTGRHSEDNRVRPSMPLEPGPNLYERSRTMPTAISEAAVKPGNQPRPPIQTNWQEPGPTAGYYGPNDRGFTPTTPVDSSERQPYSATSLKSNQRPYGHAATQTPKPHPQQLHAPQDSLGDVFDNYYDPPEQDYELPAKAYQSQTRPARDEYMPNFDAVHEPETTRKRGMTLDKHLQPQQNIREHPPTPAPPHEDDRRFQRGGPPADVGSFPRSRSQPNLKERRSPRQAQDDGFDFGIPGSSGRPPATAPATGDYNPGPQDFNRFPPGANERPPQGAHYRHDPETQRAFPAAGHRTDNFHGANASSSHGGPSPAAYQNNEPRGRYHSPPQGGHSHGPPAAAYQDQSLSNRYRSPPIQSGNGPSRPPGGRPPVNNLNMAHGPHPGAPSNNRPSPSTQNGRPSPGQTGPPGTRPPPSHQNGPTSPPIKPPSNPDALPAHPAPVRAAFMEGSPVNQAPKPAPVRQYNAIPSPMQLSNPSRKPGSSHSTGSEQEPAPVTHQELDRLKQATARNPEDLAKQLLLAKKMVEAATVLVDERGDSRGRSKGREKFILDAYKIVKKLSGNGYNEATFYLADSYTRGALGLESDTREAFKLYQSAAKSGHAQAAYRVAVCCEIGQEEGGGTSRDPVKAMQWYKRAATLGDAPAMYKMGIISLKGLLGQPKNPREAVVWLKRAAERADKENPHALHELALMHEKPNSNDGVAKDEAYSKQLFTQAANLGYKFSQYRLGCAYEYGSMGCPVDPRQSIAWYSKAAVQEEYQSELALSGWYLTGSEGILQQSDTEAYLWARKAASAGLAKAEYAMGYFTEVGIGSPANMEDAKRWYWRAASQNFPKARDRLEELRRGSPTKRKERMSRSNMRKSTEGECIVM